MMEGLDVVVKKKRKVSSNFLIYFYCFFLLLLFITALEETYYRGVVNGMERFCDDDLGYDEFKGVYVCYNKSEDYKNEFDKNYYVEEGVLLP